MGLATAVAAVGVGLSAFGLFKSSKASEENARAQQAAIAAQQEAERLRKQQMDLDAMRRRREVLRQSTAARSASLAITTAQGGSGEGASALPGAYGSISGRANVNASGINQNQALGGGIFDAHQDQLTAYRQAASAQSDQSFWNGIGSIGGKLIDNAAPIGQVGTYIGGKVGSFFAPEGGYTGWAK